MLDEPTASLSDSETNRLFEHIDRLKESGVGIVYISHRLDEISRVADSVTVMRNGARPPLRARRDRPSRDGARDDRS